LVKTIPKFKSEQEEAEFWDTHDSTDYLDDTEPTELTFVDARPQKRSISLRIDGDAIDALKDIAGRKGMGYQTLIRMWVMERLEKEVKAG
jgi:predicted DNA binding CopG/RHH family protein